MASSFQYGIIYRRLVGLYPWRRYRGYVWPTLGSWVLFNNKHISRLRGGLGNSKSDTLDWKSMRGWRRIQLSSVC